MKKFAFAAASIAVIGAASVTYAFSQKNQKDLSDIQLTAIEVLSEDDDPGTGNRVCYNFIWHEPGLMVRHCPVCGLIPGNGDISAFCM